MYSLCNYIVYLQKRVDFTKVSKNLARFRSESNFGLLK